MEFRSVWIWGLVFCVFGSLTAVEIKEETLRIVSGNVVFIGETQVETVQGVGKEVSGSVDLQAKTIAVRVPLANLKTGNSMRDGNMHEDFLETARFPAATFSGKLDSYDAQSGKFMATGVLTVHGVAKKNLNVEGTISTAKKGYLAKLSFHVFLKEHGIAIPKVLFVEMENNIQVKAELLLAGQ